MPETVSGGRFDLETIKARLADTAESWVPQLFPNGRRVSNQWRLANIRGDAPRKNGSCVIDLAGQYAGGWFEHQDDTFGDAIDTIAQATGLRGRELFAYSAELTGVVPGFAPLVTRPRKPSPEPELTAEVAGTRQPPRWGAAAPRHPRRPLSDRPWPWRAQNLGSAVPSRTRRAGRLARARPPWSESSGMRRGARVALQLTYLSEDSTGKVAKAEVNAPRKSRGSVGGGAVRLGTAAIGGWLALSEGIETGLSVMAAKPDLPVWACFGHGGSQEDRAAAGDPPDRDPGRQ